jgi:cell division transport system permease protein
MGLSSIEFILQETAANIYRNRLQLLAAVSTVAVTLMILGAVIFGVENLRRIAGTLPSQFEITVHLKEDVTQAKRDELRSDLNKLPGTRGIIYRSKKEVYASQKAWLGKSVDLSGIEYNPQTDEFRIQIGDLSKTQQIVTTLKTLQKGKMADTIDEIVAAQEEAKKLSHLIDFLRIAGAAVIVLLIGASALIISNALKLTIFARRREIKIMQLVGATNWFIRVPYILEGMFHGLAGAIIASLIIQTAGNYVSQMIKTQLPFLGVWQTPQGLIQILIGLGALLGAAGSFISIRKFLKV